MLRLKRFLLKDKDFLETDEGFFQVIGYVHPKDYIVCIPRYIKVNYGTYWFKSGFYYDRVLKRYGINDIISSDIINKYLIFDNNFDTYLPMININKIKKRYYTDDWASYSINKDLFKRFIEILEILTNKTSLPSYFFGITGSLLISLSNSIYSDIDIVIFGRRNTDKIKEVVLEENAMVKPLLFEIENEVAIYKSNLQTLKVIYNRKWYKCKFKGRYFSINPVKLDDEIKEKYGETKIKNISEIEIIATVKEIIENYFYPFRYSLKNVEILAGPFEKIEELTIYNSFYMDSLTTDDIIHVKGILRKIISKDKEYFDVAFGVREVKDQFLYIKSN
jgi:Uncharacterized protein conserved in archaea